MLRGKTKIATKISVLLLFIVLLQSALTIPTTDATGYLRAAMLNACDALPTTTTELQNVYWAFGNITNFFNSYPGVWTWVPGYGWYWLDYAYDDVRQSMVWNSSDPYSTTTKNSVLDGIDHGESSHMSTTFLYVGHTSAHLDEYDTWRYGFFMNGKGTFINDGVQDVSDAEIYSETYENHNFVFLWVCRCGHEEGDSTSPARGMPVCWAHDNINDGYHCFLGFDGASPRLEEEQNGYNHVYRHWLVFFYYFALYNDVSVDQALDHASYMQDYSDFEDDRLYETGPNYSPDGEPEDPDYWDTHWDPMCDDLPEAAYFDVKLKIYGNSGITFADLWGA